MKQNIQKYLEKIKSSVRTGLDKAGQKMARLKKDGMSGISVKMVLGVAIPLIVFLAVLWFFVHFSVKEVIVLGNIHYTKEEITETVQQGLFGGNTLLVSRGQKSISPDNLDLVDQIDVEMKDEHTLQITVQERQLIGYVQYLDCNLYFDSEGRIMNSVVREEKSEEEGQQALAAEAVGKTATSYVAAMKEAPLIRGLSFDWAQLYEILPVEDASVFNTILGISRMINKYSIAPDAVDFDEELNITLEYGNVTVDLGADKLMEEKLARVAAILPSIEGKSGILHMEDYDGSSENIVFSQSALTAEDVEDESGDAQSAGTAEETVSHEYALVIPEGQTPGKTALTQQTGQTAQDDQMKASEQPGTTQQPAGQSSGTTQQPTGQSSGTAQQAGDTQPGASQQQPGTSSSQPTAGSQEVQISKPVLNNLP